MECMSGVCAVNKATPSVSSQSFFQYVCLRFVLKKLYSVAIRVDCFHSSNFFFLNQNKLRFVSGCLCIKMHSEIAQNRADLTYAFGIVMML